MATDASELLRTENSDDSSDVRIETTEVASEDVSIKTDEDSASVSTASREEISLTVDGYKDKHKIGSRKAAETVLTYNEPVYQSLVSTMFEKRKQPKTVKRVRDSDSDSKSDSSMEGKKRKNVQLQRSVSYDHVASKRRKVEQEVVSDIGKIFEKWQEPIPLAYRRTKREASLNASTFVNMLYAKDLPKPKSSKGSAGIRRTKSDSDAHIKPEEDVKNIQGEKKTTKPLPVEMKSPKAKTPSPKPKKSSSPVKNTKSVVTDQREKTVNQKEVITKEEKEEKKRRANLARLKKAKELFKKGKLQQEKTKRLKATKEEVKQKPKPKKGNDTCQAARTHVIVTPKHIYGGNWCSCCRPSYYSPSQGNVYWTNKEYRDHACSGPVQQDPKPSSSTEHPAPVADVPNTFASPRVPLVEGSPFVSSLITHGHIPGCTSCLCGGMLSGGQCQNFTLGGVGSLSNMQMMSCHQSYNSAFPVAYPHSHSSFTHCACSACCPSGTFHSAGSPIIHQTVTADPSRLLHHPVPLQITHTDSGSHGHVSMPCSDPGLTVPLQMAHADTTHNRPVQLSHSEASRSIPLQMAHADTGHSLPLQVTHADTGHAVPIQLAHGDGGVSVPYQLSHSDPGGQALCLQISHGEAVNVTHSSSSVQSDHEIIDVGSDDVFLQVQISSSVVKPKKKVKLSNKSKESSLLKKKEKPKKHKKEEKLKKNLKVSFKDTTKNEKTKILNKSGIKERRKSVEKISGTKQTKVLQETVVEDSDSVNSDLPKEEALLEKKKVKKHLHGWSWEGEGETRTVNRVFDGQSVVRTCYSAIRHDDGEVIQTRDCILVCSGPRKKDVPYVAKVTSFWEDPDTGEMMMTLLWYYRPEHTEAGRKPSHKDCELFAAKHRDETCVACIDDKGYVLTYNEYCRYMAEVARSLYNFSPRKNVVPEPEGGYPSHRIPPVDVDPENVFLCRQVYDFKLKRILKNPS